MKGGEIGRVREGGPGYRAGLTPGDRILTVNAKPLFDYLSFEKETYSSPLRLEIITKEGEKKCLFLKKEEGEPLGIQLVGYIYDDLRLCKNHCLFCFVHQQPEGMRKTLYLKDDDYRFSFYQGSYITLTNLEEEDFRRIITQDLSPLYISIHTTNPGLRVKMLGNKRASKILKDLQLFKEGGISFHGQLVLCPDLNDGHELVRTLRDLEAFYPYLLSLSLIPVGLTRHRKGLYPLRSYTPKEAEHLIHLTTSYQKKYQEMFGYNCIYAADEFYLLAERPIPKTVEYDGFPQYENGVGLVRSFYQEVEDFLEKEDLPDGEFFFVTSSLGEQALGPLMENFKGRGLYLRPLVVENKTFGPSVTVTGLLTGQDILDTLKKIRPEKPVFLPGHLLNQEGLFLDDLPLARLREEVGAQIILTPPTGDGLLQGIKKELSVNETTGGHSRKTECR